LYTNAHSDAIYGMMNGNFIGRCPGVEKYEWQSLESGDFAAWQILL
jgi:hypothetical protein